MGSFREHVKRIPCNLVSFWVKNNSTFLKSSLRLFDKYLKLISCKLLLLLDGVFFNIANAISLLDKVPTFNLKTKGKTTSASGQMGRMSPAPALPTEYACQPWTLCETSLWTLTGGERMWTSAPKGYAALSYLGLLFASHIPHLEKSAVRKHLQEPLKQKPVPSHHRTRKGTPSQTENI